MADSLTEAYRAALNAMAESGPKPLVKRATLEAEDIDPSADVGEAAFRAHLVIAGPNDPLVHRLRLLLARWDDQDSGIPWARGSEPRTPQRRQVIYQALGLDADTRALADQIFRVFEDRTIIISKEFEPWYSEERRSQRPYYWPHYAEYLRERKGWDVQALASLDRNAIRVVERLADPERKEAYQSKGLVVGYVQSGKTANFTGVIAKAVDAGYRLILVLTGTTDILRRQTQRRIDMELVGEENILRNAPKDALDGEAIVDYLVDDPDWRDGMFIRHGILPSAVGAPDIIRLTAYDSDYQGLRAGIAALEFERRDHEVPLYDPQNLYQANVRLAIVKKNSRVLTKLVRDLRRAKELLIEVPTLIIDDESDQASVNTTRPRGERDEEHRERTAVNRRISDLLGLLPRAQYVGYTATPFANVFIDPSDAVDIFPKDFILSLDRPPDYMGASDFHDLDDDPPAEEQTVENSREKAHVRSLSGDDQHSEAELRQAIDAFVLTGAVKLYREEHGLGAGHFRHHTMLIHQSVKMSEHRELASAVRALWAGAGYLSPTALPRLRQLYLTDLLPVSRALAPDLTTPGDFEELVPYIARTVQRIQQEWADPVIVVNSDKEIAQQAVDFEKRSVWRILVGGTKLSRGFTVEGLTISYYRRTARQADTLMQMGRWFGFRKDYRDLVRLYISRSERKGRDTYDLYEAFEAACLDEEFFRDQLRKYAHMVDGKAQILPRDIPPLVAQHLPWVPPTARNKMFNARLVELRSPGEPIEPRAYPNDTQAIRRNTEILLPLLDAAKTVKTFQYESG
ncbi:MAG TPA: Z1 domain-containing protein, partial [Chloroflexota bacterium]|nr:Z1 domain-containing protein [Chloroflexota bacterium]